MKEKLPVNHEQNENLPNYERLELPTAKDAEPLRPGEKDPSKTAAEARQDIAETAQSEKQVNPIEQLQEAEKAAEPATPTVITRGLKQVALRRELLNLQRHESPAQRALSKVIHQPVIRNVSEAAGKTISRPSGLLGGGLLAFVGSSSYLYLAKHQGFKYNYLVFLALFTGGFLIGLALELMVWTATSSRRQPSD